MYKRIQKENLRMELSKIIDGFNETQQAIFAQYKKKALTDALKNSKKALKIETDKKFIEFLKNEIEYFELCLDGEK